MHWTSKFNSHVVESAILTTLTAGTPAHTKAATWTEVIASTLAKTDMLILQSEFGTANSRMLIDIGIGAASSETTIISNLYDANEALTRGFVKFHMVPVSIPRGTRISVRSQASGASNTRAVALMCLSFGFVADWPTGVVAIGVDESTTSGTTIDPGSTASTKGSYVELIAATDRKIVGVRPVHCDRGNTAFDGDNTTRYDLAIGSAGNEQIVWPDFVCRSINDYDAVHPDSHPWIPLTIPKGTRLSARASSVDTNATDRLLDLIIYGLV